jgi:hypothetical protein
VGYGGREIAETKISTRRREEVGGEEELDEKKLEEKKMDAEQMLEKWRGGSGGAKN